MMSPECKRHDAEEDLAQYNVIGLEYYVIGPCECMQHIRVSPFS